jgi:hypothetical protein
MRRKKLNPTRSVIELAKYSIDGGIMRMQSGKHLYNPRHFLSAALENGHFIKHNTIYDSW